MPGCEVRSILGRLVSPNRRGAQEDAQHSCQVKDLVTAKSLSLSFWLGRWLKGENACTFDSLYIKLLVILTEQNCRKVPIVRQEMPSVLKVGWNANHERRVGLLDRMMVHVDRRRI